LMASTLTPPRRSEQQPASLRPHNESPIARRDAVAVPREDFVTGAGLIRHNSEQKLLD
jgi:hypothetical protein